MNISCIIPAYNESSRIAKVLDVICAHPKINEVIVVDDASADGTSDVVSEYFRFPKLSLIAKTKNGGKTKAIYDGIKASTCDYLLMIDADLVGLAAADIDSLIVPVEDSSADVSMSLRKNSPWVWLGIDYISGERLLPKNMFDNNLEKLLGLKNFALEVFINRLIIKNKFRISVKYWPDVVSPLKYNKHGLWNGIKGDTLMMRDIFATVSVFEIIYQIYKMMKLTVAPRVAILPQKK